MRIVWLDRGVLCSRANANKESQFCVIESFHIVDQRMASQYLRSFIEPSVEYI